MAPVRQKYQWSEQTRTATCRCQFCGNIFKPQGFRAHEKHCGKRKGKQQQRTRLAEEYERDIEQGMFQFSELNDRLFDGFVFFSERDAIGICIVVRVQQRRSWSFKASWFEQ
ncbi:hypothetical protein EV363DRAFT_1154374 [Boletus edulis]|nr:hypothetical protein EV363DRAFT_1154374 [Boletus edulis]